MNPFPAFFFTAEFGCCFGIVTCLHLSCLVGAHMQKSLTLSAVKHISGTLSKIIVLIFFSLSKVFLLSVHFK